MPIEVVDSITSTNPQEFDALDASAGAVGCYEHLRQREADRRWLVTYLRWIDDGTLMALIPLYWHRGRTWPAKYDPSSWQLPEESRREFASAALLVGGCSDGRSGLHVAPAHRNGEQLRYMLAAAARQAAEHGVGLVFPFVYSEIRNGLDEAASGAITWALLAREAHVRGISDPEWESKQKSRVRYVLRRDRRLMAAAGVKTEIGNWADLEDSASDLIASHNIASGRADHAEFVRMRYREWAECPGVQLVVFSSTAGDISGVLTALTWNNQLELCEVGISGQEGPDRLAVYIALLFHEPIKFAQSAGLTNMRAGIFAETPKSARGAVFENLYGGVLTAEATRKVAECGLV